MKRDLARLSDEQVDVCVVGGGVLGACIARDAALRGLRTALIESGDFGGGTSAHCLKVVHGGLRYLADLDLLRARRSAHERSVWLRIAPHLVEPWPFVAPALEMSGPSGLTLRLAAALDEQLTRGRNRGLPPHRHIPPARHLPADACAELLPAELSTKGGLLFHDGLMYSSERLVLEVVRAAWNEGAAIANYVAFRNARERSGEWVVEAEDAESGESFQIRASMLVNAAGAGAAGVARGAGLSGEKLPQAYSVGLNLVLNRPPGPAAYGITISDEDGGKRLGRGRRFIFVVPWRGRTLVGTGHEGATGSSDTWEPSEEQTARFVTQVNRALAAEPIQMEEIVGVHAGLQPAHPARPAHPDTRDRMIVHEYPPRPPAITAILTKYTTARALAERTVDRCVARLGRGSTRCRTATVALPGAPDGPIDAPEGRVRKLLGADLRAETARHLARMYGAHLSEFARIVTPSEGWSDRIHEDALTIRGQMTYAVEREMAVRAEDLVWRRTELGPRGQADQHSAGIADEVLRAVGSAA
jgi:glycerol-3-phosphate dehydrogenase